MGMGNLYIANNDTKKSFMSPLKHSALPNIDDSLD